MNETIFQVDVAGFCGGFVVNETGIVIETAPFLIRIRGLSVQQALYQVACWDGVTIKRVSTGTKPDIPKMPKK